MDDEAAPKLSLALLRPYVSLLILEYGGSNLSAEQERLAATLRGLERDRAGVRRTHPAFGLDGAGNAIFASGLSDGDAELVYVDGYVTRTAQSPSWQIDGPFEDVTHKLTLLVFWGRFVAIASDGISTSLQTWLDKHPRPPFRRVAPVVMERAFLGGDAKSLWLNSVHSPRTSKANSKQLSGPALQDALDPHGDSSFSLSAGRAEVDESQQPGLAGKLGVTPGNSTVWLRKSESAADFVAASVLILKAVSAEASAGNNSSAGVLPWLAVREADLTPVSDAFHVTVPVASDVPPGDLDDDLVDALAVLEDAEMVVHPRGGADFVLEVGTQGTIGGSVRVQPTMARSRVRFAIGWEGAPTDLSSAKPVMDALNASVQHLRVHYESGHMVDVRGAWSANAAIAPFPGWRWEDFSGFDVWREKPDVSPGTNPQSAIGNGSDKSLFSWVHSRLSSGYLACDDGAGEVGDFVHLAHDDTLTVVHVKSAKNAVRSPGIAVQQYEVVASQAVKNLARLRGTELIEALSVTSRSHYATWLDGRKLRDRHEFLEMLEIRKRSASIRIVIVQPQVNKVAYNSAANAAKVRLLDGLLNSARTSATSIGAEFEVWACE